MLSLSLMLLQQLRSKTPPLITFVYFEVLRALPQVQVAALWYRPGRLDKILYVPLPPPEGRGAILQALTRKTPLAVDVDVAAVGASPHCHGFSGADLAALVREACICALKVCLLLCLSLNLTRSAPCLASAQMSLRSCSQHTALLQADAGILGPPADKVANLSK